MSINRFNNTTNKVLEYIQSHPGCYGEDLHAAIPGSKSKVGGTIQKLRAARLIENRGRGGLGARWYLVEFVASPAYLAMADDLVKEMLTVHSTQRKTYLAMRLEEIFGS